MCGRYSLSQTVETIASAFRVGDAIDWSPRYNIAPTQSVPTVSQLEDRDRQFRLLRWGLVPSWAKDLSIGAKLINARSETVAEKPSFRSAFKQRRCLILADGFYEWQRRDGKKQPHYFQLADRQPFAFAGLWEHWQGDSEPIESCTILTTQANDLLQPIHDRMPVILASEDYDRWLDLETSVDHLHALLHPYDAKAMTSHPVSSVVNSPKYDQPDCINSL